MAKVKIGFIGFGEVGYTFSRAMNEAGAEITAYDILLEDPKRADDVKKRISETGSKIGALEDVLGNNAYVLSTVTTQAAKEAAETCATMLEPGNIYVDLNSTSPSVKVDISKIIETTGAEFVEAAILGAVGVTGAKTRIFTGGVKGREVAETLNGFGMNVRFYSPEIGKASTFKMLRSIFSKGVEALLLEMMVAGRRAGIEMDLWEDITNFMASKSFDKIGTNWMQSHAVAHKRRYYEMLQVIETMGEIGIRPVMTERTAEYFKQSIEMEMSKAFAAKPGSFNEVIEFIENNLK